MVSSGVLVVGLIIKAEKRRFRERWRALEFGTSGFLLFG